MEIISRTEAEAKGLTRYFSGEPCSRGHVSERYLSMHCVQCHKEKRKERYESDPDERARNLRVAKEWHKANRAKRLQHKQKWYQNNKEQHHLGVKEWQKKNPEKVKIIRAAKRARRAKAPGTYKVDDILAIKARQRHRCAYCRKRLDDRFHIDHIVPIALGGTNWPRNLQLTCPPCNLGKSAKEPTRFAREIGLLV